MEEEVEGERAEIKKGCYESPVLRLSQLAIPRLLVTGSYLVLHKDSPEAVEELEWRDDMTLNKY